jgi:hypothetical protein
MEGDRVSPNPPENGFAYRIHLIEEDLKADAWVDKGAKLANKHELELHGERGVYRALEELTAQLRWTQRALWGLAGSILLAAVAVAFGG